MKRLVLVRHGESTWNAELRVQGQSGAGLSQLGFEQAGYGAKWIAGTFPDALIVTSDLLRCKQTADPICNLLGQQAEIDEGLRERDFGTWTGRLTTDIATEDPQFWQRWQLGEDVIGEVGGEYLEVFTDRVSRTLHRIMEATPRGRTTVCVTHRGPIVNGVHVILSLRKGVLSSVANSSISSITFDDGGAQLTTWNQTGHIPARRG